VPDNRLTCASADCTVRRGPIRAGRLRAVGLQSVCTRDDIQHPPSSAPGRRSLGQRVDGQVRHCRIRLYWIKASPPQAAAPMPGCGRHLRRRPRPAGPAAASCSPCGVGRLARGPIGLQDQEPDASIAAQTVAMPSLGRRAGPPHRRRRLAGVEGQSAGTRRSTGIWRSVLDWYLA
jgi:hypothetical protein